VYTLVGFFVAPTIVRSQLEKRLAAQLRRDVRIAKVALNPLTLSGSIEGLTIRESDGTQSFVSWKRAFANFDSWSLLRSEWRFDEVALDGAQARVAVDRDGKLNFADLLAPFCSEPAKVEPAGEPKPLRIGRLSVTAAKLDYREDAQPQPFATVVGPVSISLREFSTGGKNNAPGEFAATTESGETIGWRGALAVAPLRSSGELSLGNIVLKKYMPYVARFANFTITDGTLALKTRYELVFAQEKPVLRMQEGAMTVKSFKLGAPGATKPAVALDLVEVGGLAADSNAKTAAVGRVALAGGKIEAGRDAQGIDLLRLLEPKAGATSGRAGAPAAPPGQPSAPAMFDVTLGELAVTGFALAFNDTAHPRPARVELENVSLNVKAVSLAQLSKASPLEFSAVLAGGGTLKVTGSLAPQPLKGDLALEIENAPLSVVSPYVETFVNVRIAQGTVSAKARALAETVPSGGQPAITAHADASINDFQAIEGDGTEELVRWKTLSVRGIEAATSPSLKLLVADLEWTDPVGSVIVAKDGTLNLSSLLASPKEARPPASAPALAVSFKNAGATSAAPGPQSGTFIAIDRFQLQNAAFRFVDRSMEPEVKLSLNQLSGSIAGLSSANLARADVDLKGKVDGVAPVSIRGQINPLASEAFTDLKVDFRGIDLLPTAPYVGKYAGYQLERGALSLDVKARLSQRRLDTTNVVTLDEFTLGQKTPSPEATKLPVGLALALLRDRQGKILLDVPVQGSLDDPEFRIGRVVWRVIGNILTKAATSPFSLLGSMFGGGNKSEELAFQEFERGSAELTDDSIKKLGVVAKALTERPGLRLDVSGAFGSAADAPALRERELEKGLRIALWEEQRKVVQPGAVVPPPEQITLTPEDSARLIGVFYRAAFAPRAAATIEQETQKKPDNVASEQKTQKRFWTPVVRMFRRGGAPAPAPSSRELKPPPSRPYSSATAGTAADAPTQAQPPGPTFEEMRAKLLAAIAIDENVLRELAGERSRKVRSYLIDEGQIAAERISLVAETAKGPRVDLQLK
jgi:hypothetical protein